MLPMTILPIANERKMAMKKFMKVLGCAACSRKSGSNRLSLAAKNAKDAKKGATNASRFVL